MIQQNTSVGLFILQGLPGIGHALAGRLLDAFGGVENVFHADADALSRVERHRPEKGGSHSGIDWSRRRKSFVRQFIMRR